jgi:DNA-binding transcriptional regulator YiaG
MISGTELKEWRKQERPFKPKGFSRTEMAFLLGVSVDTIHRGEQQGKWPLSNDLEALVSSGKVIRITKLETMTYELKCDLASR